MFSERVPRSLEPNRITQALRRAREARRPLIDLTVSNPTRVGLQYPPSPLATASASVYEPQPFGLIEARRAVSRDYTRRGVEVAPERVVLTASTSEAYSLLFKLLCNPSGDAVMVPAPSYPLFEHLTTLDCVRAMPYRLDYHGRWTVAIDDLDRSWIDEVRAVLAVSPNNPTGSMLSADETCEMQARCAERGAALIIDEVFADYVLAGRTPSAERRAPSAEPQSLTFRLGGLSKSAGLPQVKLGWIALEGPEPLVAEALARLEVICDAYLSVSTFVQEAAPALIESGANVRGQILDRIRRNYRVLTDTVTSGSSVEVLHTEAGWSTVLRVPSTRTEEELVLELIDRDQVIVYPGFFYDFPHEAFVVLSLLPEPDAFDEGVRRLLERVNV
jgi:aspartate/methionine/tyrosine aminotransferase